MDILFWNVGESLTPKKQRLVKELAQDYTPAVFCVAEGSQSMPQCQTLIDLFAQLSYQCYYSPLSYQDTSLGFPYAWHATGLKVFIRPDIRHAKLTFAHAREKGRIVVVQTTSPGRKNALVFLHNMAKSGNRASTDEQTQFLSRLPVLLYESELLKPDERPLLIGDFNLEPWDALLRNERILNATFLEKHLQLARRAKSTKRAHHTAALAQITASGISNLGGTYYSKGSGWALFDYVLHTADEEHTDYEIITTLKSGEALLLPDEQLHKNFLTAEIDHLPIHIQLHD